jgi:hypothetical protein
MPLTFTESVSDSPRIARRRLREQIGRRMPCPGAERRVAVSAAITTAVREPFFDYTRISGQRADVLDYAAFLFATDTGWGDTALDVAAIERDDGETLTVLLAKPV